MKLLTTSIFLIVLGSSCSSTVNPNEKALPATEKITEQEALDLLHKWTDAYLSENTALLDEVLDESWLYAGSANGKTTSKPQSIEEFSNADYVFKSIDYQNLDVRLYDDVAIVRGTETMVITGRSGENPVTLSLRFTDVYRKTGGKIRAISTHSSPIVQE